MPSKRPQAYEVVNAIVILLANLFAGSFPPERNVEKPVTLHADVRPAPRAVPGREARRDSEYERRGTANDFCAEFGGIFCKTRKGKHEVNLPLIELEIPQDSPNFQFIDDYWYWFWNWR